MNEALKENVIKMYTDNPSMSAKDVAFQIGTNLEYAQECIEEHLLSLVMYYDMAIAPSCNQENVFFLFSENGTEKKLHKDGNVIYSEDVVTKLEQLFIKINLGCETVKKNSKK